MKLSFESRCGCAWNCVLTLSSSHRNIDRILVSANPTEFGEIYYKDHGLLLCEVHLLRQSASKILPRRIFHDFLVEIDELVDVRSGLERQRKVVERIRWAYSKWLT